MACAGLHNFLRKECRSDLFHAEPEPDNEDYEEENLGGEIQTQDEQREDANDWRAEIANHMWEDSRPREPEPNVAR